MWNEIQRRIRSLVFNLILYQGLCESKVFEAGDNGTGDGGGEKKFSYGMLIYFCHYKITFKLKDTWK